MRSLTMGDILKSSKEDCIGWKLDLGLSSIATASFTKIATMLENFCLEILMNQSIAEYTLLLLLNYKTPEIEN